MVINESAYYQGKLWCAYELKDHFGNYKEELRLEMRKESQNNQFTCPDCGEKLILCAGPIMEPFFKHHKNSKCIINHKEVNRRNVVARRMLYHLAKDSFPDGLIEVDRKLEKGISPDIYIECDGVKLVFEYLSYEGKLNAWEEKHLFYQEQGIVDVWFLNYKKYQYETKTTFEYMVLKYTKVLKFIDYETREIILKEKCETSRNRETLIAKAYPIEELTIGKDGEAVCDYLQYKADTLALMEYEEKVNKLKIKEEALKRNHYRENSVDEPVGVQQSLFDFTEFTGKPKVSQESCEEDDGHDDQRVILGNENQTSADAVSNVKTEDIQEESSQSVRRHPLSTMIADQETFQMTSLGEVWELPELTGEAKAIQQAGNKRMQYLEQMNMILQITGNKEQRETMAVAAVRKINTKLEAEKW